MLLPIASRLEMLYAHSGVLGGKCYYQLPQYLTSFTRTAGCSRNCYPLCSFAISNPKIDSMSIFVNISAIKVSGVIKEIFS